jgi:hypothetical protein
VSAVLFPRRTYDLIVTFIRPDPNARIGPSFLLLKKATVNRYLKKWGYDVANLTIESPAVRFQAEHANEFWQFDLSSSDQKKIEEWPDWIDPKGPVE